MPIPIVKGGAEQNALACLMWYVPKPGAYSMTGGKLEKGGQLYIVSRTYGQSPSQHYCASSGKHDPSPHPNLTVPLQENMTRVLIPILLCLSRKT
eukprot:1159286-Pelagomonas_calceolata.AAC.14